MLRVDNSCRPPTKLRKGNVFTGMCLSVHRRRWSSCHYYPWCIGPHCTGPLLALDPSRHGTWGPPGLPLLVTSGGHHLRPVQTCSLDLTVQPPSKVVLTFGDHQSTFDWQSGGTLGQGNVFTSICHSVQGGGGLPDRDPLDGKERAVRILLECILAIYLHSRTGITGV